MAAQTGPRIVGIGASAGGVRALQELFASLPSDTGAAFVVVVHLDPGHQSELAAILGNRTAMKVTQVSGTAPLSPNEVYVIPPGCRLEITDTAVSALDFDEPRGQRAPIDLFFRSLAAQHSDGFAVVLTGGGSDGAIGVRAVKESGGIVLVQDPDDAEHPSMPRAAIATGVADFVLPLAEIGPRLAELIAREPPTIAEEPLDESDEDAVRRILAQVRVRTGHDFDQYKRATVLRRIARRAQVARCARLGDYDAYMRGHPEEEIPALFSDLLISVTTFFRDPEAYEVLRQSVIPRLFDGKDASDTVRVWTAGCATGEEAYSIAMLLAEEAGRRDVGPEFLVFASDLDAKAIAFARAARYPAAIEADVTEARLRRFFLREPDHYRVRQEIRERIVFAHHNLLRDPPFSHLDLVECRNVLIYLERDVQRQVCGLFHYALNADGFVFLGPSESADSPPGLFRTFDKRAHVYQRLATREGRTAALPHGTALGLIEPHPLETPHRPPARAGRPEATHREALERFAPPSVLVDREHLVIHASETAGRFLQVPPGAPTTNVTEIVRPELRYDLRAALHRAFARGEPSLSLPTQVQFEGQTRRVYVQVRPIAAGDGAQPRHALVMFIEGEEQIPPERAPRGLADESVGERQVRHLYEELQLNESQMRSMREDTEAANEELRAANEELQSINEEYRSTAEELETSQEELQSVNEELHTVNGELKSQLDSLSRAHSDLQNLIAASDVGTLFLDANLCIKLFTPRVTDFFNIVPSDQGRPITDFTHRFEYDGFEADAHAVIERLTPVENEIRSGHTGRWYLMRLRPYRTVEDRIEGIVASFLDITERRASEESVKQIAERLGRQTRLVELSRAPIFVWELDAGILEWNRGSQELYGYTKEQAIGCSPSELLKTRPLGGPRGSILEALRRTGSWSGELCHTTRDGRELLVDAQLQVEDVAGKRLVLESTRDMTDVRALVARQRLLLDELTHRVRNTLTIVQSIAHQTVRNTRSADQFVEAFDGRLLALSAAHKLLVNSQWEGAELRALAESQLAHFRDAKRKQLSFEGEPVRLPAALAMPFGLALHELASNAAKYGALSVPEGHVALSWRVARGVRNEGQRLTVVWQERDGPPVKSPERSGFGSTLIRRGLPGAKVDQRFEPDGVRCTIELTIPGADGDELGKQQDGDA